MHGAEMVSTGFVGSVDTYRGEVAGVEPAGDEARNIVVKDRDGLAGPWRFLGVRVPAAVGGAVTATGTPGADGGLVTACRPAT